MNVGDVGRTTRFEPVGNRCPANAARAARHERFLGPLSMPNLYKNDQPSPLSGDMNQHCAGGQCYGVGVPSSRGELFPGRKC